MRLPEVLSDIGLNMRIVMLRRRKSLLMESLQTLQLILSDRPNLVYNFGSQSEGTTTPGLKSDVDTLVCRFDFCAIQDLSEWKLGLLNYLMIQDQTVTPGYCLLQLLRKDAPDPATHVPDEHYFKDCSGRILLRNTAFRAETTAAVTSAAAYFPITEEAKGPAHTLFTNGVGDTDFVNAFQCKSWPIQARQLDGEGLWSLKHLKRDCSKTGCFVVPVGSKGSENHALEWRISTSLAERHLMFSLNITQIRCYVLMKMLLKTFIKPCFEDAISNFMCKTLLFHTIANTHSNYWRESNLISCISWCLLVLYNYVLNENCPHFIIPGNNLMAGHVTHESKPNILGTLLHIIKDIIGALLWIDCDDLGERLLYSNKGPFDSISSEISGQFSFITALHLNRKTLKILLPIRICNNGEAIQTLLKYIFRLNSINHHSNEQYQKACMLLMPWFYTTLGSVIASLSIEQDNSLSANALAWISMGLNDLSSKLKQASIFYCIGDSQITEKVLRVIEEEYDINIIEPTCTCYLLLNQLKRNLRKGFLAIADNNDEAFQFISAFCVRFLKCELNCVPHDLRYEMFRSTKDDIPLKSPLDIWMDLAVVDSLPYMYFLQYKTYLRLRSQDDKQRALSKLLKTIKEEPSLGHRETALNLLGQCMEGEDRVNDASNCYVVSLSLRERNNAAKVHICRLISKLVNTRLSTNHSKKVSKQC